MLPETKARKRLKRRQARARERQAAELAEVIKAEAISRSQIIGRSDRTVWSAYHNLKNEVSM